MKILISADIEGASGVITDREIGYPKNPLGDPQASIDYLRAREWLTKDINSAVEGAMEAGATNFVVHDTHGMNYRNANIDNLHSAVELVGGRPLIFYESDDLDNSFDAAFLVGMHARGGEPGVLSHVLDWPLLREVRINGKPVGESEVTIGLSSYFGIPTVLITGDQIICEAIYEFSKGEIETAVVKNSLSRYAAHCLSMQNARERIREAAYRAIKRIADSKPIQFQIPITLEVEFLDREIARYVSWMPEVAYDNKWTTKYMSDDFLTIYKVLCAKLWIASSQLSP
jgi:D-amino peptidase